MATRVAWLVGVLLVAGVGLRAQDSGDRVEEVYARYRAASGGKEFREVERRLEAVRELGTIDSPRARELLCSVMRSARSDDDRVIAMLALGRTGGVAEAERMLEVAERTRDPVLHQVFGQALAQATRPEVLDWIVTEVLASRKPEVVAAGARAVAVLRLPAAEARLVELYDEHVTRASDVEMLHELVRALGMVGGEAARGRLLQAAAHGDERVRLAAADVLAFAAGKEDEEMLAAQRQLLHDPSATVRQIAARASGAAKLEPTVPMLIDLLSDPRLKTRRVAQQALCAISGRDFDFDASTWRIWWNDHETAGGLEAAARKFTYARYYGFGVFSDRVVFVCDLSGSMRWPDKPPPSRIDIARAQMRQALQGLPEGTLFNIVVFSDRVRAWQRAEAEADAKSIARAQAWVEREFAEPDGDTRTWDALETAFAHNPSFDTIYFLSDGVPSDGDYVSHEGIAAGVAVWNRFRRATIHTIALTMDRGLPNLAPKYEGERRFMKALADSTGGECHIIAHAPRD